MLKRTLTLTELADYININKRTIYRMLADRRFPIDSIRGTKPRRWAVETVDKWLANGGEFEV